MGAFCAPARSPPRSPAPASRAARSPGPASGRTSSVSAALRSGSRAERGAVSPWSASRGGLERWSAVGLRILVVFPALVLLRFCKVVLAELGFLLHLLLFPISSQCSCLFHLCVHTPVCECVPETSRVRQVGGVSLGGDSMRWLNVPVAPREVIWKADIGDIELTLLFYLVSILYCLGLSFSL